MSVQICRNQPGVDREVAVLRALGEPTRLRLAALLAVRGDSCVCHLSAALGEADFKISRHLGILKCAGIVEARREGTWMHYRLARPESFFVLSLRRLLRSSLREHPAVRQDLARLAGATCR